MVFASACGPTAFALAPTSARRSRAFALAATSTRRGTAFAPVATSARRGTAFALAATSALAWAQLAAAQGGAGGVRLEDSVDFSWDAPAYCPSSARVLARAAEGLGDLAGEPLPRVRARAEVRPAEGDGRWHLALRTEGPRGDGERSLEASSCEELADAAALVLTLLVRTEFERAVRPTPPARAEPPASTPALITPAPHLRGALRLGALLDAGTLPQLAPGLGAAAALLRGPFRAELSGVFFFPQQQSEGPRPGTGGKVGLVAGGLRGCYRPFRPFAGGWEVNGCLGAELGYLRGEGVGLSTVRQGGGVWSALLAGGWVGIPLGEAPVVLRAGVEGGRTLAGPHFEIDDYGKVFEPSSWLARFGLGLEWQSP
ncbi:MAG: hypothetical protein MUF34_07955 [Polyangiaceae bacterium]|nr:hypothetical protein [Polyangiaceae bacterium]